MDLFLLYLWKIFLCNYVFLTISVFGKTKKECYKYIKVQVEHDKWCFKIYKSFKYIIIDIISNQVRDKWIR
ncbi:hypothetical protein PFTANZ_03613 [Plasmodium falciparum Tanzania (2000708)]|uniref:Uncharacterized protein n=4 Tax=Plasmodium falciparum TaxID=5833 RepID=W7JRT5_PLAFO|nr:hypothetical protein PFTANZ_03613 [Plasmodium falciparum Tanzania (2000708)]ETW41844.1 hypothetical protein PFNF135_03772 [Plasmodium falciparum NF135/5.C10]ETW58119.1 hypothetical protein PFMC_05983 [Plasmodium falciparum CAMP/Malaysia]EWC87668.1 hypothetical protein PFNF54_03516 [Plasmodium falciparum NF54]